MKGYEYEKLREMARQRRLSEKERLRLVACLALQPDAQRDWESEIELDQALRNLPDVPLSSNFTAQVLNAVAREQRAALSWWKLPAWLCGSYPRWRCAMTWGGVALCTAFVAYEYNLVSNRAELAQSVAKVSSVAAMPSIEVLQDFEAINRLSQVLPGADLDLLATTQ